MGSRRGGVTTPIKGLSALGTEDARFFFGREALTGDILERIRRLPDRVLALIGNSGVGKSSLAQAGVIASLRSQVWAGDFDRTWPSELEDSRSWLSVTITPGEAPLKELAYGLVRTWAKGGEAEHEARVWAGLLATGSDIEDLLRNTADEIESRANDPPPRRFLLYIDQGEELYARSDIQQAKRFSELLSSAVARPEIVVLASLRSDYYGFLQADEPLFARHRALRRPAAQSCTARGGHSSAGDNARCTVRDRRSDPDDCRISRAGAGVSAAALVSDDRYLECDAQR